MTDTTAPNTGTPASMEQIHDLIAQLKTFNNLLAELLRDRDQPAISDVIRDHLIAVQRIEASFTAATEHLIAALRRQEALDRSSWDQDRHPSPERSPECCRSPNRPSSPRASSPR